MTYPSKIQNLTNMTYPEKKSDLNSSQLGHFLADMESKKVVVTLATSKFFGRYGVIQKVTPKKFKIRFWDTGEETYLWQTSVEELRNGSHKDRKNNVQTDTPSGNKRAKARVRGVNHAVSQLLQSADSDGVTRDEWEGIVDKIGKMFIWS